MNRAERRRQAKEDEGLLIHGIDPQSRTRGRPKRGNLRKIITSEARPSGDAPL
jgi:hypothetical protein